MDCLNIDIIGHFPDKGYILVYHVLEMFLFCIQVVTEFCKFIGLVSSLNIDFAICSGSIRLPFWVSMEMHCHSVLEFSNEYCLCEHWVHLPGSEVCEEVGVYKTVGPNTVKCCTILVSIFTFFLVF